MLAPLLPDPGMSVAGLGRDIRGLKEVFTVDRRGRAHGPEGESAGRSRRAGLRPASASSRVPPGRNDSPPPVPCNPPHRPALARICQETPMDMRRMLREIVEVDAVVGKHQPATGAKREGRVARGRGECSIVQII